jgi:signal transduction histidine kinase
MSEPIPRKGWWSWDVSLRRRIRVSGTVRVWALNALLATIAGAVYLLWVRHTPGLAGPQRIPWWVMAAMFALAEISVVHFQLRREAHSFSLSEIPLVLGLFFTSPPGLVAGQLLGAAAALIVHRRQSPMKLAFNLGHFCIQAGLAAVLFHAIAHGDPLGPRGWVATFAAISATTVVGAVAITAAISLSEGRPQLQGLPQRAWFATIVASANGCIALIGVNIMWIAPQSLWLLIVPAGILFLGYRAYTWQRQKHETLRLLYESTRVLQSTLDLHSTIGSLLTQAREMFRADIAEVTLFPASKDEAAIRSTKGPGDHSSLLELVQLDPTEGVWARIASEGEALLLSRPIQSKKLRDHLARRGIRDAIVAPLHSSEGVIGKILVANRLGDVTTFDSADLSLLHTLANHASISLENARLVGRLEESLAHLTEMNRMKDDFVATVSHELRTPLTSIRGSIKTLLLLDLAGAERQALLEAADRGGGRLQRLIEDLLMVSRIESYGVRPVFGLVSVPVLAADVVEGLAPRMRGRTIELAFEDGFPRLETDRGKVEQILTNLFDNALKYSAGASTVTVTGRVDGTGVVISVENRGEVIPIDHQDRIFDRFVQVNQSSTRPVGGAGLGLYICRRLAELIGGRVWLERSDQVATVFNVFIPLTPPSNVVSPRSQESVEQPR